MYQHLVPTKENGYWPRVLQRVAMVGMLGLVLLSFLATNLQALLWQSSSWLVGAILPAVVVEETNEARAKADLDPVSRSETLDRAATLKAEHMAKNGYFAHYSPEGISPWHWFSEAGYQYAYAGENLAVHFTDSEEVVEAWLDSPTHRANIENQNYREIGIGTAKGSFEGQNTVFVVQLFGTPARGVAATPQRASDALGTREVAMAPIEENPLPEVPEDEAVAGETAAAEKKPAPPETAVVHTNDEVAGEVSIIEPESERQNGATLPPESVVDETEIGAYQEPEMSGSGYEVLELSPIATTSGLAPAPLIISSSSDLSPGLVALATQPNKILHTLYVLLGSVVALALIMSLIVAYRAHATVYITQGAGLLLLMSGLFLLQALLTDGAIIL